MAQDSQSIIEFRYADMEAAQFVNATRGKRSKRPRPGFSVLSASEEEEQSFSSSLSEDEEEDEEQQLAAYSLIMIAHARSCFPSSPFHSTAVKSALPSDAKMNKPKELHQESEKRYKCKTCNKKFFSFQALGGHRASCHKIKSVHSGGFDHQIIDNGVGSSSKDSQNLGVKFHECPICFRVFTSGQALGGHKRSHTSSSTANHSPSPAKAEELQLDLNMPAVIDADGTETEEDHSAFSCTVTPPHYEKPNYKFNPYWWMEGSERSTPSQDLGFKQDLFFVASVN